MNEGLKKKLFVVAGVIGGAALAATIVPAVGATPFVAGVIGAYMGGRTGRFFSDDENRARNFKLVGAIAGAGAAVVGVALAPVAGVVIGLKLAKMVGVESTIGKASMAIAGGMLGMLATAVTGPIAIGLGLIAGIGIGQVANDVIDGTAGLVEKGIKSPVTAMQNSREKERAPVVEEYMAEQQTVEQEKKESKSRRDEIYKNSAAGPDFSAPTSGDKRTNHWRDQAMSKGDEQSLRSRL